MQRGQNGVAGVRVLDQGPSPGRPGYLIRRFSRALAHSPLIPELNRRRIERMAGRWAMRPMRLRAGLVTRRTQTIGVIVTSIDDPFVAEVVRGIRGDLRRQGLSRLPGVLPQRSARAEVRPGPRFFVARVAARRRHRGLCPASARLYHLSAQRNRRAHRPHQQPEAGPIHPMSASGRRNPFPSFSTIVRRRRAGNPVPHFAGHQ